MKNKAIADPLELISWIFVILLAIAIIVVLTKAQQSLAPQKNMLTNVAYAHVLPELIQTKTHVGKTIGELIAENGLNARDEINSFMQTMLAEHEYAVYLENDEKILLTLIAGKPVGSASVILQGLIAMPDTTAKTLIIQISTESTEKKQAINEKTQTSGISKEQVT
ncbi:MAG: hypothetical protein Q7K43_03760 [Candidatus Woesearchaeota archaeon]|nr:hypothetical protein [Candidatus Woesearchaeota archaeon]